MRLGLKFVFPLEANVTLLSEACVSSDVTGTNTLVFYPYDSCFIILKYLFILPSVCILALVCSLQSAFKVSHNTS